MGSIRPTQDAPHGDCPEGRPNESTGSKLMYGSSNIMNAQATKTSHNPSSLRDDAAGSETRGPAEILKRIEALGPLLDEDANAIEETQHLTPRVKEALARAGAFAMAFPAEGFGGPQMRLDDQIRLLERVAYHSTSAAWNIQILSDGGYFAPKLDPSFAKKLFKSIDHAVAGSTRPAGRMVEVDGGYRVTGRWSFGSGIRDADSLYAGFYNYTAGDSPEADETGRPVLHQLFLPMDQVQIHNTWFTTGLSGSGSTEFSVKDVFVPHDHKFTNFQREGDLTLPPLSRHAGMVVVNSAGVPLGIARRAIHEYRKVIEKPTRTNQFESMKHQDPNVPTAYAEAVAYYEAARAYVLTTTSELSDTLFGGQALTSEQMGKTMEVTYMSGTLCRHAIEVLLESLGARSVLASFPFDRLYRDMSTVIRHGNHRRKALEMAGVFALELPWPKHMAE